MPLSPNADGRRPIGFPKGKPPLRILQVAVAAGCGLLFLKAMGLVTHGGYIFTDNLPGRHAPAVHNEMPQFARALSSVRSDPSDDPEYTGSVGAKKDKPPEAKKDAEADVKAPTDFKETVGEPPAVPGPAEMQVLQRLRERRDGLDQRSQELEMRENLLKAAEKKIEGRIGDLKTASGEGAAGHGDPLKPGEESKQMKTLVTIYENMKPKDAARVFDRLDMKILVSVINSMNPRKVSDILAAMSPDVAQKLTVALMTPAGGTAGNGLPGGMPSSELQRIDQAPAQP